MTTGLVGSEMCIRDRAHTRTHPPTPTPTLHLHTQRTASVQSGAAGSPGSDFTIDLQTARLGGHLAQVHLSGGLQVHGGCALDVQGQRQTAGCGHRHLRVQELLLQTEPPVGCLKTCVTQLIQTQC